NLDGRGRARDRRAGLRDLPPRVGRRLPADRPPPAALRRACAGHGLPREPPPPPGPRPREVRAGRRGRAASAVRRGACGHVPLPDRGLAVRRRRLSRVRCLGQRGDRGAQSQAGGGRRSDARAMRAAEVIEPGIQTTIQDYPGRRGMQAQGFFPAGPMDHFALRAANLLVGNEASAAGLEITLGSFALELDTDATVALCGAEAEVTADGETLELWENHPLPAGTTIRIGVSPGPGSRLQPPV